MHRINTIIAAGLLMSLPQLAVAEPATQADKDFVEKAAVAGMTEVKLGKLAEQNGSDPEVKAFGKMMVKDHTAANDKLKQVAQKNGYKVPTELTSDKKDTVEKMSKLMGKDFDKEYIKGMVKDHEEAVSLFKKEASDGMDGELKTLASDTVPTLEHHHSEAEKMQDRSKS